MKSFAEVIVRSAWLLVPLALAGCTTVRYVDPVPDSAWRAANDSPRTSYPTTRRVDPARPSVSAHALTRDEVLTIASSREPGDAIAEIDRHPLAFPLTQDNVGWFEDRVAPPEVVDYLRKRGAVNWDALSSAPAPAPQATPSTDYGSITPDGTEATPSYADDGSSSQPSTTTIYVDSPPPTTTYIYQYDCAPPTWWGGTVFVWGGCYYGCRPWQDHCYTTRYCAPRTTYYGAYSYGSNGYTYYPAVSTRTSAVTYRPGTVAGLYPTRTYSTYSTPTYSTPTYSTYAGTSVRTQPFVSAQGGVRTASPVFVRSSTRVVSGGGGGGWHGGGGHHGGHHR